jgi:hypothetical protein
MVLYTLIKDHKPFAEVNQRVQSALIVMFADIAIEELGPFPNSLHISLGIELILTFVRWLPKDSRVS